MAFTFPDSTNRKFVAGIILWTALQTYGCASPGKTAGEIPPFKLYWSLAVADLNSDGKPDIAATYTHFLSPSSEPGFAEVHLQDPGKPGIFLPSITYSSGEHDPVSIAIGDLNGDGKPDMVIANESRGGTPANTISVLLQDPANPGQFLGATSYAAGNQPSQVAIGDLDGDGRPDLAVATAAGISLLFQSSTTPGSFLPPVTLAMAPRPSSVAISDVNGDLKLDLVATSESGVSVFLQDPASPGTFGAAITYTAGIQPSWVAIGDLNGDGKPDLVVANSGRALGTGSVSVLLQDPFKPGVFLGAKDYVPDRGIGCGIMVISDVNGDQKPDLVVGTLNSVWILLQDPSQPGLFQSAADYPTSVQTYAIAVNDLNGDNKPDLLISDGNGLQIRFQDPTRPGVFLAPTLISPSK